VVLKGLRTLAERGLLPGRAPVRLSGAGESATSELGMKKAQIEANGDETQVDGRQNDRSHDADSGGQNRTQIRGQACQARCSLIENPDKIDLAGGRPES